MREMELADEATFHAGALNHDVEVLQVFVGVGTSRTHFTELRQPWAAGANVFGMTTSKPLTLKI